MKYSICAWLLPLTVLSAPASAEVIKVDVASRTDAGSGYEQVVGRLHFAVDPKNPRNAVIADIDKAPRNAQGLVEFVADFALQRPVSGGNGAALIDVVNRGGTTALRLNRSARPGDTGDDGLLRKMGITVMAVGWEFDVPVRNGAIRIDVPVATDNGKPIAGIVRATFTPNNRDASYTVGDLAAYPPVDANGSDSVLTVRDRMSDRSGEAVPRGKWKLAGNVVTLTGGFEPGRNYEIAYRAANPPISGLGLAAVRDAASWLKNAPETLAPVKYVYALGVSQSGRFLRDYLYEGFNTDEKQRQVFDGMMVHIAGASQLDLNRRWATPTGLGQYDATLFPFADRAQKDAASGATDGLLDNDRARANLPKIFYTNTGVEYWGGGRTAALVHTTADGTTDLNLPANVRAYFFAGNQHGPGAFPPAAGAGQQKGNPTDYWWNMRALFVAMDKWVREGAAPPPSRIPRLSDNTLVKAADVAFPVIPGVQTPKTLTAGSRAGNPFVPGGAGEGAPLPLLVPQVDADGNEVSGIRLPEVAVPLATYTGWNFRSAATGGTGQLVPLLGSYVPLARTKAERESRHDPRPSIEERYASRQQYLDAVNKSAAALVKEGYLLAADVPSVVKRATDHWEFATHDAQN
jgi:Alpha/beta hydrolase domain